MYKKRYYRKMRQPRTDRIKVIVGDYKTGDLIDGKKIVGFGKEWQEGPYNYQYAYFTERPTKINVTTFSSGDTVYQNSRGRCEDAPCCGCCS